MYIHIMLYMIHGFPRFAAGSRMVVFLLKIPKMSIEIGRMAASRRDEIALWYSTI